MGGCRECGGEMARVHRRAWQKLVYKAVFSCRKCGHTYPRTRAALEFPSIRCRCPRCRNADVKVLQRRDPVEGFNRNPLRLLEGLLGAKLCYCFLCRLQFYDFRPLGPRVTE